MTHAELRAELVDALSEALACYGPMDGSTYAFLAEEFTELAEGFVLKAKAAAERNRLGRVFVGG